MEIARGAPGNGSIFKLGSTCSSIMCNIPMDHMMVTWARRASLVLTLFLTGCVTNWSSFDASREPLQPWLEIAGAQESMLSGALRTDYTLLQIPAAISFNGNELYIVDLGLKRILRYDRTQQLLLPFNTNIPVEKGMSIHAAEDKTVYVTSPSTGKVLRFSWDGVPLTTFSSPEYLEYPVSVAVDEHKGKVLVVDGLYNRIVVFNKGGGFHSIISKPLSFASFSAITTGPDGIYATDMTGNHVAVLGWRGELKFVFSMEPTSEPSAIAVNREGMVFVGDNFDNSLWVFSFRNHEAKLILKIGRGALDRFNSIGGVAVASDMVYVSDSLNARIQAFMINYNSIDSGVWN